MNTWHLILLVTARIGVALFLLVFLTSTLRRLWKSPLSAWLLRNRRYWGLAFAGVMAIHLVAIFALMITDPHMVPGLKADPWAPLGGAVGYLFLAAMALTSNDRSVRILGRRRWRRLHSTGMYVLWIVFMFTYAVRAGQSVLFFLTALALLVALLLKFWVKRKNIPPSN